MKIILEKVGLPYWLEELVKKDRYRLEIIKDGNRVVKIRGKI